MTSTIERQRLAAAQETVRSRLLGERNSDGHWIGELSSSPLSTATAISALVLAEQSGTSCGLPAYVPGEEPSHVEEIYRNDLSEMIVQSLKWLAKQQNDDGGWGDTDRSRSNIATTMLVQAAFHLTGVPAQYQNLLQRAQAYVDRQGGISALKQRYEGDKTFAVPILANCALADLVPWRKVPALPFELSCLPQSWYHRLNLPVVSYAIPALVAIGQAKHYHCPSLNPVVRGIRNLAKKRSLEILSEKQPGSGGFLEATPLTSFVVMSLASTGQVDHPVVRKGVEFLLASVRPDGSWPIDTNLATWNTSQAVHALQWQLEDVATEAQPAESAHHALDWLLSCQHREQHAFTGADPGGWAWTDLSGGVPDADDTSAALLALVAWHRSWPHLRTEEIRSAALAGTRWLLDLQNRDGGWPTFCRGWGKLPFDRSSNDISAHAIRALHACGEAFQTAVDFKNLEKETEDSIRLSLKFLEKKQLADGSWLPLWFGNQSHPQESNPVYGTSKVLTMYEELGLTLCPQAQRAATWMAKSQHASGGWGVTGTGGEESGCCSVEETSLAIVSLLPYADCDRRVENSVWQGLSWLIEKVENGQHTQPAAIGFYFAKLWYHERLYPQIFATQALSAACKKYAALDEPALANC